MNIVVESSSPFGGPMTSTLEGSPAAQTRGLQDIMWRPPKEEHCLRIQKQNGEVSTGDDVVYRLTTQWSPKKAPSIRIMEDHPYACGGSFSPNTWTVWVEQESTSGIISWKRTKQQRPSVADPPDSPKGIDEIFDLLWGVVLGCVVDRIAIDSLPHDSAASKLYEKLKSGMFEHIGSVEFLSLDGADVKSGRRKMRLCCKLLRGDVKTIHTVFWENLFGGGDEWTKKLVLNSELKKLDLRSSRHIHSWRRTSTQPKKDQKANGHSLGPLVESLRASKKKQSDLSLDLSGNRLSHDSALGLARSLPQLDIGTLTLRDTELEETTMLELVQSLKAVTCTIRELDLSHNPFSSMRQMEALVEALTENTTLERLTMDHCGINFDQIQLFARSMADMKGLRHLSMNGNPFTWYPILNGVYRSNRKLVKGYLAPTFASDMAGGNTGNERDSCCSFGLAILVKHLEQSDSKILLSLEAGDFGGLDGCWGMSCCTTPQYDTHLSSPLKKRMQQCLRHNQQKYDAFRKTRPQEAVIKIAKLLLEKKTQDDQNL